jgi:hypothetical protein
VSKDAAPVLSTVIILTAMVAGGLIWWGKKRGRVYNRKT